MISYLYMSLPKILLIATCLVLSVLFLFFIFSPSRTIKNIFNRQPVEARLSSRKPAVKKAVATGVTNNTGSKHVTLFVDYTNNTSSDLSDVQAWFEVKGPKAYGISGSPTAQINTPMTKKNKTYRIFDLPSISAHSSKKAEVYFSNLDNASADIKVILTPKGAKSVVTNTITINTI